MMQPLRSKSPRQMNQDSLESQKQKILNEINGYLALARLLDEQAEQLQMARKIANYTSENNDYAQEAMARMKNENARLDELLEEQQQVIEELELVSRAVTRDVFFECKNEAMKLRSDINTLENRINSIMLGDKSNDKQKLMECYKMLEEIDNPNQSS